MARTPLDTDGDPPSGPAGYARPPARHRIRDGEVRNPWGRRGKPKPKVEFLDEPIEIRVDGEPRRMTRADALDYFLFAKAAKGDVRAIRLMEERARQRRSNASDTSNAELTAEEQAALNRFVRREAERLDRGGQ